MEIFCHQIIEHCLCYSEIMTEFQFLKDLSETFPNCNFKIHRGVKLRLAVITRFYIYWFDIIDSNYYIKYRLIKDNMITRHVVDKALVESPEGFSIIWY